MNYKKSSREEIRVGDILKIRLNLESSLNLIGVPEDIQELNGENWDNYTFEVAEKNSESVTMIVIHKDLGEVGLELFSLRDFDFFQETDSDILRFVIPLSTIYVS